MSDIAAPAVHVDKWKRWDFLERCRNTVRSPPAGCGAALVDGQLYYEELSTGRLYRAPDLSLDGRAWVEADAQAQLARRSNKPDPRNAGPFGYAGSIYSWGQNYVPTVHLTYMATFLGVSQMSTTAAAVTSIWPGFQPPGPDGIHPFFVLQPVMIHVLGEPTNYWHLWDVWNIYGVGQVGSTIDPSTAPLLIQPQGIWGVIREYGGPPRWLIQFFRGNKGNIGPALGQPKSLGLTVSFSGVASSGGAVKGSSGVDISRSTIHHALCEMETSNTGYFCSDISIQAVFGGVTLQSGPDRVPVNWTRGSADGLANGVSCVPSPNISAQISNGSAQLSVSIAG